MTRRLVGRLSLVLLLTFGAAAPLRAQYDVGNCNPNSCTGQACTSSQGAGHCGLVQVGRRQTCVCLPDATPAPKPNTPGPAASVEPDLPAGAVPTKEQYLAWAKAFAAEYDETYDEARLIVIHQLTPYKVSMQILQEAAAAADSYWKEAILEKVDPGWKPLVQPQVDKLRAHIQQDLDELEKAFKNPAETNADSITRLRAKMAVHVGMHRAALTALQEAIAAWKAIIEMRSFAKQNNIYNSKVRFLESQLKGACNRLVGAGEKRANNGPVIASEIARINGLFEGKVTEPEDQPPPGKTHDVTLFANWTTNLEDGGKLLRSKFVEDFWLDVEAQQKAEQGIHLLSMALAITEVAVAIPKALTSLQAFLASIRIEGGASYEFALVGAGAGSLGRLGVSSGATIAYDITTLEELLALVKARAVPVTAGAWIAYSKAGTPGAAPVGGWSFGRSDGILRNCENEAYPRLKIAGSDELVPTPTRAQLKKLELKVPSPDFPDAKRQAFKVFWQEKLKQVVPKGFKSWNDFWDKVNVHHIIPRSLGGSHEVDNLLPVLIRDDAGVLIHQQFTNWWIEFLPGK